MGKSLQRGAVPSVLLFHITIVGIIFVYDVIKHLSIHTHAHFCWEIICVFKCIRNNILWFVLCLPFSFLYICLSLISVAVSNPPTIQPSLGTTQTTNDDFEDDDDDDSEEPITDDNDNNIINIVDKCNENTFLNFALSFVIKLLLFRSWHWILFHLNLFEWIVFFYNEFQ